MKKNKILAGLSALVMGATMMAGTAMNASAITVTGNGGDGGFWSYYDTTPNDGIDNPTWAPAPYGMYDGNISNAVANGDGTVTLTLTSTTYTITDDDGNIIAVIPNAAITGIYDVNDTTYANNLINNNQVTLTIGDEYLYDANNHHTGDTFVFLIS